MKALIWIGCCTLHAVVQNVISTVVSHIPSSNDGSALTIGLISGLLSATSACICIWLAIILCKKSDWNRVYINAAKAGMSVSEYGKHGLSQAFLSKLEELCNTVPYEQVKAELKACVRKGKITKDQYIILLNEYCKVK